MNRTILPLLGAVILLSTQPVTRMCLAQDLPDQPVPIDLPNSSGSSVQPQPPNPLASPLAEVGPAYVPEPSMPRRRRPVEDPESGWFLNLDVSLVGAHISNGLTGQVMLPGYGPDTVQLPNAGLEWSAVPRLELGYRLGNGWGALLVSGRFQETDGHAIISNFDVLGDGFLKSRLEVTTVDVDYESREIPLGRWDIQWRAGARFDAVYFDSQGEGQFMEQTTSSHFVGGGPHVGLDVWRHFNNPSMAAFARIDGTTLVGHVHQDFEEAFYFYNGSVLEGTGDAGNTQAVPVLNLRLGLSWVPYYFPHTRYTLGYEFEQWWAVGHAGSSRADLTDQGILFRAEFNF